MTGTESFWDRRPVLTQIRQHARARRVAPWAVLGGVLARATASTDQHVALPAIIGGRGSLNLFIGIVGRSGQGKGASQAAAADLCTGWKFGTAYEQVSIGSGEGLAASFVRRSRDDDGNSVIVQHTDSALVDVAEVDTLAALTGRSGSTLLSELRKAWSGERLGFQNRSQDRTLPVDAHAYRLALTVGIQPARAAALLDDTDGGTPQRFIWMPATDPDAPERAPRPTGPITWTHPGEDELPTVDGRRTIRVCDVAWDAIDQAAHARLRGQGDALDGHALMSRLKVAAAFALLDQRGGVTDEDWSLAGEVMKVSDATRADCQRVLADAARDVSRVRAEAQAVARVHGQDAAEQVAIAKATHKIIGKLTASWTGSAMIRKAISPSLREHFDAALDALESDGVIEVATDVYQGQERSRIRLTPSGVTDSPPLPVNPENPRNSAALSGDEPGLTDSSPPPESVTPDDAPADPGCCAHGVTVGRKCRHCAGTARKDAA